MKRKLKSICLDSNNNNAHNKSVGHFKLKFSEDLESTLSSLIGETPLIKLNKLSLILKREIFVKMECNNPAGTGKDRAVKYMLKVIKSSPHYRIGMNIIEGTSGSTGIALALQCNSLGLNLHVVMPDDQSIDKRVLLERLGSKVIIVPSCSISNKNHYVNTARRMAQEIDGIFVDQFENEANYMAHYEETGPEIWSQMNGKIDVFVMSAGTGGTIAGVSRFLKEKNPLVKIVLADPFGSSLLHKVLFNVCYTSQQAERTIKKHRYDSIVEGVGLDRITKNFEKAIIDTGYTISDQEVINTAHWILKNEGLFIGSSSALNIAAAIKASKSLSEGSKILTIICDSGNRHISRFWNPEYIVNTCNLVWPKEDDNIFDLF